MSASKEIKLQIKKNDLLSLLGKCLNIKLGKKVTVRVETKEELYGIYEEPRIVHKFYFEEEIDILGQKAKKATELSEDDISEALNIQLAEQGYSIRSIDYDTDWIDVDEAHGLDPEPEFGGITLHLNEDKKILNKANK